MSKMRAVQVSRKNGPFEMVEREIPEPGEGEVRLKVQACGICHSDSLTREGTFSLVSYPRVPGHEVAGVVDAVGAGVAAWKPGERAGAGWNGGYCGYCDSCRRGDFFACRNVHEIAGITRDGGYAEYMIARAEALAHIPAGLPATDAAPLMCAGVTTYNCLRHCGARPGDLVAVLGIGGLGHLAVQFAARAGYRTVAIARGPDKAALARELGAAQYIDSVAQNPANELRAMGGAAVVLATATSGDAMAAVMGGLAPRGTLMVIGAAPSLTISPGQMIGGSLSVKGWYSGTAIDSQDTLAFSAQTGVRSRNEIFRLERVEEAYDRMMSGSARFRVVLAIE